MSEPWRAPMRRYPTSCRSSSPVLIPAATVSWAVALTCHTSGWSGRNSLGSKSKLSAYWQVVSRSAFTSAPPRPSPPSSTPALSPTASPTTPAPTTTRHGAPWLAGEPDCRSGPWCRSLGGVDISGRVMTETLSRGQRRLPIPSRGRRRLPIPSRGRRRLPIPSRGRRRASTPGSGCAQRPGPDVAIRLRARQPFDDLGELAARAGEERHLLAHVPARLGGAQLAHEVDDPAEVVGLEAEQPLVVAQRERGHRVGEHVPVVASRHAVVAQHRAALLVGQQVPLVAAHERVDAQVSLGSQVHEERRDVRTVELRRPVGAHLGPHRLQHAPELAGPQAVVGLLDGTGVRCPPPHHEVRVRPEAGDVVPAAYRQARHLGHRGEHLVDHLGPGGGVRGHRSRGPEHAVHQVGGLGVDPVAVGVEHRTPRRWWWVGQSAEPATTGMPVISPWRIRQLPGGASSGNGASSPRTMTSGVSPRSRPARSRTRSTRPLTNRECVPAVAARAACRPSSRAVPIASVSRSQATSMWSEMKPMGAITTRDTPSAASWARWSLMSGSSHGVRGSPEREQYDSEEVSVTPSARKVSSMTWRTDSCCSR